MRSAITWTLKIAVSGGLLYWLLTRIDRAQLWALIHNASVPWLLAALGVYLVQMVISAWRWEQLLLAQDVNVTLPQLTGSYMVAGFFNNFLPSNIGGDVIRIRDTSGPCGSTTRAATIVLLDRAIGLIGLVFIAAIGATIATELGDSEPFSPVWLWVGLSAGGLAIGTVLLSPATLARMLTPLRVFHQQWVDERISQLTEVLERFGQHPSALLKGFSGSLVVQACLVGFYSATARAMGIPVPAMHLAVLIPMSFVVQMLPLSVNGFGIREYIFGFYFARLHLPKEQAIALSFLGAVLIMIFSISGAVILAARKKPVEAPAR